MALDLRPGERVYQEIKQAILSGEFAVQQRLDIDRLSSQFGVSATPVRYGLAILAAERLVRLHASRTYHVAFWSERELRELYAWRQHLAEWSVETFKPGPLSSRLSPLGDYASVYLDLMQHLDANANIEARRAGRGADERLQPALRAELEAFADPAADLNKIIAALPTGGAPLKHAVRKFFKRRIGHCAAIRTAAQAKAKPPNGD